MKDLLRLYLNNKIRSKELYNTYNQHCVLCDPVYKDTMVFHLGSEVFLVLS